MGIINGKNYEDKEYWAKRLEEVLQRGVTVEDLQDLSVDLSMENLSGDDTLTQVPCVVLSIPLYSRGDNDEVVPFTMDQEEEVLEQMEQLGNVCGYVVDGVTESVTYVK